MVRAAPDPLFDGVLGLDCNPAIGLRFPCRGGEVSAEYTEFRPIRHGQLPLMEQLTCSPVEFRAPVLELHVNAEDVIPVVFRACSEVDWIDATPLLVASVDDS